MPKFLIVLLALISFTAFGKCPATKTLMTPNKTDMKELVDDYKEKGWKTKGKMVFKEYIGFFQVMVLSCEKVNQVSKDIEE